MAVSILQITINGIWLGQQAQTRWHMVNLDGAEDVSAVLPNFTAEVVSGMAVWQSSDYVATELLYRIVTNPLYPQTTYGVGFPIVGTQGNHSVPTFTAVTVAWAPEVTVLLPPGTDARRIRRGGKRLPGVPEIATDRNALVPGEVSPITASMDNWLGMSDGGFRACIAGFPKWPEGNHDPDDPTLGIPNRYALIGGVTVKSNLGTQLTRKIGHGN